MFLVEPGGKDTLLIAWGFNNAYIWSQSQPLVMAKTPHFSVYNENCTIEKPSPLSPDMKPTICAELGTILRKLTDSFWKKKPSENNKLNSSKSVI